LVREKKNQNKRDEMKNDDAETYFFSHIVM
jgi:hypothetical protein